MLWLARNVRASRGPTEADLAEVDEVQEGLSRLQKLFEMMHPLVDPGEKQRRLSEKEAA